MESRQGSRKELAQGQVEILTSYPATKGDSVFPFPWLLLSHYQKFSMIVQFISPRCFSRAQHLVLLI
jgi:hypothetical protein